MSRVIEDVYGLSPMQAGMLFHSVLARGPDPYARQWSCRLAGPLDVEALRVACRAAVARHGVLRTSFHWEELEAPVQVVHREVDLPWQTIDLSDRSPGEQGAAMQAYADGEHQRRFDVARPPLLRITLMRAAPDRHLLTWTYHHLIMDAWSRTLLLAEALRAVRGGDGAALTPSPLSRPYRDYIAWLGTKSVDDARAYWRGELASCPGIDLAHASAREGRTGESHGCIDASLSANDTARLQDTLRRDGLTWATASAAVWAMAVGECLGRADVVIGIVVSGRPPELTGSDRIVGPFINVLPFRARVPSQGSALEWLRDVQRRRAAMSAYEHCSLIDVQRWTGVPQGRVLFDAVLNMGLAGGASSNVAGIAANVEEIAFRENHHLPLAMQVAPGSETRITFVYDRSRWPETIARRLADAVRAVMLRLADGGTQIDVASLVDGVRDERRRAAAATRDRFQRHFTADRLQPADVYGVPRGGQG